MATLVVAWTDWCGSMPGPLKMRVALAGDRGTVMAPLGQTEMVPDCVVQQPSTIQVVCAYEAGRGGAWRSRARFRVPIGCSS
jgi:hypothetical protein